MDPSVLGNARIIRAAKLGPLLEEALAFHRNVLAWKNAIFLGVDSPLAAFASLELSFRKGKEGYAVLGPALDGGVYLIGVPENWRNPFRNVMWGSDQVYSQLLATAEEDRIPVQSLPKGRDLDTMEDLTSMKAELLKESRIVPSTASLLSRWKSI